MTLSIFLSFLFYGMLTGISIFLYKQFSHLAPQTVSDVQALFSPSSQGNEKATRKERLFVFLSGLMAVSTIGGIVQLLVLFFQIL